MSTTTNKKIRIAILDLYEGQANQGMRCIRELIIQYAADNGIAIEFDEFDVRQYAQVPGTGYDAYISSGGPGSPLDSEETLWENKYFNWLQQIEQWNNDAANTIKKRVLFICHSFQLACRYYNTGVVCKRKSTSFGVFPIHMLQDGFGEIVFEGLKDPFYAVDSRDYQVIKPNYAQLEKIGGKVLSIEKERPHVPYDRAVMAIRFNKYFVGTQFHPEADPIGMSMYLQTEEKKKAVIDEHGEAKWSSMVAHLQDPDKIVWTYNHILPNFLNDVIHHSKL
ncbi:type 1 glutamine amidotransferase [Parasediminibacterium sp. JCM 36343]|uniref:type 1 glutamine amidotransferase n=1 Tax=Parasediminibacterium sp. JCM 36343 TaxID=3374279 RepID=UPI0039786FC0